MLDQIVTLRVVPPLKMNLGSVFEQLRQRDSRTWTAERCREAKKEYQRFLALCKVCSKTPIVPSQLLDEVWHQHVLNTKRYLRDCEVYFGYFLHHRPVSTGVRNHKEHWNQTLKLYREVFGEEPPSAIWRGSEGANCDGSRCNAVRSQAS
ncbi:MAG: hypothetical protein UY71_C0004G0013 [Parcubacteria group bacterium GW2011_GWB1_52_7]|nr:MAG: hypothetical protein UY64_C0030G0006 [Parcubacteria group bacterium GW2011_GWA1_51_12]KKW29080.1 MAG: hypothetical protein UY71_C0004G0013 [Parcubacteria group bacterium GW2011_GWB1_52_7]KKW30535.1 MAG: hypothetical protein UY75_C0030G0008 [Parcubacteria group bacterium GW2011_GWC2_52_8c]